MMKLARNRRALLRRGTAAVVAGGVLLLGGCGGSTEGPEQGADVEDVQQDPATNGAFTDFADVQQFYGQKVTVTAEVSENLGPQAFTIADESGEALLVIYKGSKQINVETGVKVTGTVRQDFSTTAAQDFLGTELTGDGWWNQFSGEPYIEATSIETNVEFDPGDTAPNNSNSGN